MSGAAPGLKHRTDIDGLRAVAIVPVVLYHLDVVSGGLIGVDVFFVISGYLIAGLLSVDLDAGRYSIAGFYVRRARRIFPALFVVLIATTVGVLSVALPDEVEGYRNSLAAAASFCSNIYFYFTQDYFAAPALAHPLLHTWSLAVEEQFYIVFPLLLWLLRRKAGRAEAIILGALLLVSLAWSIVSVEIEPAGAFYLPHTRAWELLLGVLLSNARVRPLPRRWAAEIEAAVGLVAIVASAVLIGTHTPFPGIAVVPACLGAACIIHAGGERMTAVGRLLSLWPIRFIGLISYSWYLWHWPLISLTSYLYGVDGESVSVRIVLFVVSLAVASLSWRFVERPFRSHVAPSKTPRILSISAGAIVALLVVSLSLGWVSARRWNIPPEVARVLAVEHYNPAKALRSGQCFLAPEAKLADLDQPTCIAPASDKQNTLLIGDSHAAHLWAGLEQLDPAIHVLQVTSSRCLPVLSGKSGTPVCSALRKFLFSEFIPAHHFREIILNARWTTNSIPRAIETATALKPYADRVVIFGPIVEYKRALPRTVAIGMLKGDPTIVDRDRTSRGRKVDRKLAERAAANGIPYFSVYDAICPDGQCRILDDANLPLQFDYGHLTESGSALVARKAREAGMY